MKDVWPLLAILDRWTHPIQYKDLYALRMLYENSDYATTHFSFHFKHAEPEGVMRDVSAPLWISVKVAWMDGFKGGLANFHATDELMTCCCSPPWNDMYSMYDLDRYSNERTSWLFQGINLAPIAR